MSAVGLNANFITLWYVLFLYLLVAPFTAHAAGESALFSESKVGPTIEHLRNTAQVSAPAHG